MRAGVGVIAAVATAALATAGNSAARIAPETDEHNPCGWAVVGGVGQQGHAIAVDDSSGGYVCGPYVVSATEQ
jgi:opacity protein-like surface antigen